MTGRLDKEGFGFDMLDSLPERRSLGQQVYERLKNAIVKGDIDPGARVVESRLGTTMGISRTPVREAIHKLEREGFLARNASGGFFVAALERSDIEETFGIRTVLESYAARLAAMHHRPEELEPLEQKVIKYQECLDMGNTEALMEINTDFHEMLYGLSRSPRLIRMINDLKDQIYRFRRVILNRGDMARVSNEDHRLMLKLMRRREADKVERVVREHLTKGKEVVLVEFDKKSRQIEEGHSVHVKS
ncbi:MAG: GntR family transcriptional regulator [Desulfobacteraceae bacterium]|nr:MAG: GntR family transcriptional regulator [Desulfobacteraceae bacterium]